MKIMYPALFHQEEESYWVEFPDLPGCQSFGDSKEEIYYNAEEALEAFTLAMLEEKEPLPKASDLREIVTDDSSFASYVTADLSAYLNKSKAVKKTLTIPAWLNDAACERGINFSQVLQESLLQKMNFVP
ncbi:MAG: type II toxin-antitoxin system HicB family antitoxin [Ruminococcus flavefaciens]|nr:type II toxin-antitoxin system HicB family antitoxin [Ruminococcus flavefaciens]MCM1232664.1 type II toxin-antitoxin system HicB family antitoxin [Ruminococcus flavefaciens]